MATTPSSRRSQAERSAATREALLDATLECLVEDGYAKTTTARVAERAGLSRGAHLHHFRTRDALLAAAADHLTRRRHEDLLAAADRLPQRRRPPAAAPRTPRRHEDLLAAADRLPQTGDRVARGLDLLWCSYASP